MFIFLADPFVYRSMRKGIVVFYYIVVVGFTLPGGIATHVKGAKLDLRCYECQSFVDPENCIKFDANKTRSNYCPENYRYCAVSRYSYTLNGSTTRLWFLERKCKKDCEDYCIGMGERIRLFSCTSCCSDDLCNVGSDANILKTNDILFLLALLQVFLFYVEKF